MRTLLGMLILMYGSLSQAQQQTFDIISFKAPTGWKKSNLENVLSFSITDDKKGTWAQIGIVKSTSSKGSTELDFESEWKQLVVKPYQEYGVSELPLAIDTQSFQGWKVTTGLGKFVFNNDTVAVLLNTFRDEQRCASITMLSNTTSYGAALDEFLSSIQFTQTAVNTVQNNNAPEELPAKDNTVSNPASKSPANHYQFNTTNFDNGWTSVEKEEWVEATKGNIKVLLHYPRKEDQVYYTQQQERMNVFWNLLVAPRYSNLRNYEYYSSNLAEAAYFACGVVNDHVSGKDLWVTLFSKGKSGWIEIITPDKASFVKEFGIENPHVYFTEWDPLVNLSGMNRFAVGENDLIGKWSTQFSGSTAYYGVYTGIYAGSSVYASSQSFAFEKTKTYKWNLAVGKSGINTSMQVDKVSANGNWKMLNNWQVWFSDIERKPKTYNSYFSCIKGGRILWLQDTEYGSYTAYGKVDK